MARHMVMQCGLNEALGPLYVDERGESGLSEATKQAIDEGDWPCMCLSVHTNSVPAASAGMLGGSCLQMYTDIQMGGGQSMFSGLADCLTRSYTSIQSSAE
jgi:hypothetical protein